MAMRYITAEAPRIPIPIAIRALVCGDSVKYPLPHPNVIPAYRGVMTPLGVPPGQANLCIVELSFVESIPR